MEGRATINCAVANCKKFTKNHLNHRCSARSSVLTSGLGTWILHELAQWDRSPIRWKTTSWTNSSGFLTLHAWTASQQDDWNRCLRNHSFNEKLKHWYQQIQPFSERTALAIKMIEVVHVCLHNLSSSISLPSFLKTSDANVFSFAMHWIYRLGEHTNENWRTWFKWLRSRIKDGKISLILKMRALAFLSYR